MRVLTGDEDEERRGNWARGGLKLAEMIRQGYAPREL